MEANAPKDPSNQVTIATNGHGRARIQDDDVGHRLLRHLFETVVKRTGQGLHEVWKIA